MKITMEQLDLAASMQVAVNTICDCIDLNGLEKTIELLRVSYLRTLPKNTEESIQGFFAASETIKLFLIGRVNVSDMDQNTTGR